MRSEVDVSGTAASRDRTYSLEILLVSFAGLLLEISYTRIVSFKLFYYYTYLVIGLALLGIGTGGVVVAISGRLRRASTETIVLASLLLGGASIGIGYVVVARISIDTLAIWNYGTRASIENAGRLVLICITLFASFVAIGIVIATLFGRQAERINRLYFADLVGAAAACAVVVALISWIGPPATILLAGLLLALAGLRIARQRRGRVRLGALVLSAVLAAGVVRPSLLPEPREDAGKVDVSSSTTMFSSWSPIFRVDVVQPSRDVRILIHDGLLGSAIYRFNGDVSKLGRFDSDPRSFPFAVVGAVPGRVLIIGAAGGNEVLASLHFHARHIDAVELNPATYSLVTNEFANYSGHLADNPRVNYVNGDGRSFLARSDNRFDLVWFPAPDSYAASNAASAGAFVLSESYLYTSQAIIDSLDHTGPDGIVAAQFGEFNSAEKLNRTTRYVATARDALDQLGIPDPKRHLLVATSSGGVDHLLSTILVKKAPFTAAEVKHFVDALARVPGSRLRYAPGYRVGRGQQSVSTLITTSNAHLARFYDAYPYDVRPISDSAPFFWHFVPFSSVIAHFDGPINRVDFESGVGERVLIMLLVVAFLLAAVFLLAPFVAIRRVWASLPHKKRSATYFAALGFGFIFFEITLIQRLILFLGYPTYSLTVTLMSLLLFTGVGALLSRRWTTSSPMRVLRILALAITALTMFYEVGLGPMTHALLSLPLVARVPIAFLVLAPLGLCLGTFMPIGLGAVASLTTFPREYIAWGWAVNGFASVIGSVLSTMLAMSYGFGVVLIFALVFYLVAIAALRGLLVARAPAGVGP